MKKLLVLSMLLAAFACLAGAQKPAFEAASIKPNRSLSGVSSMNPTPGRVSMENVSLKKLIMTAYDVPEDRDYAFAGPEWLGTQRFDVEATFPPTTTTPAMREMLQTLLAERFQLALHRESRELAMLALVPAKNGLKLHAVEAGPAKTAFRPGRLEAEKTSMEHLADLLGRHEKMRVVDATGLKGVFDFTLGWSPDEAAAGDGAEPSLFTALQEQLGLRLERRKGPVEVLVVDHAEKVATGN
jgi:uncharacterized protein (TIGR03435 family)